MDRDTVEEIKRHFGIIAEDLRSDVRAVGEGQDLLREQVESLEKRMEGEFQRMDRGFQEVKAMIRLSYVEIDRRFVALEADMTDLRSRVEKLETGR